MHIATPQDVPLESALNNEPVKRVRALSDMSKWTQTQAYYDLLGFVNGISESVQGVRISDDIHVSATMAKLLDIFDKLHKLIDETPPVDQPQRFGNKSYRFWSRKMNRDIFMMLQQALPQDKCEYFTELGCYLSESFGNAVRIDYGTGHELLFLFFLCALYRASILDETDNVACGLRLFNAYLVFVRRLQLTYRLEPAGSQGVWALDDYQFIPFVWGSAQLAFNSPFDPSKFLDEPIINEFKDDYMFIGCIEYISKVKTGHFAEHSNQLWSISAVPSWVKINSGLMKMYQKEILAKFPIIQHLLFGKLMLFEPIEPGTPIPQARLGFPPQRSRGTSSSTSTESGSTARAISLSKSSLLLPPPESLVVKPSPEGVHPTPASPKPNETENTENQPAAQSEKESEDSKKSPTVENLT